MPFSVGATVVMGSGEKENVHVLHPLFLHFQDNVLFCFVLHRCRNWGGGGGGGGGTGGMCPSPPPPNILAK